MTTAQMIQAFNVLYDIQNKQGPGYEDEEILVLLNQAQSIEVQKENLMRRYTYISNLIENEQGTIVAGAPYNYDGLYTPAETGRYIGYISSKTLLTRATFKVTSGAEWIDNEFIDKSKSGLYITNSLNKPILLKPVVFEDDTCKLRILYDRFSTLSANNNFYLEYVRKPVDIESAVNCEVNIMLHERIVNTAVDFGKKVFNPQEAGVSQQTDKLMNNPVA